MASSRIQRRKLDTTAVKIWMILMAACQVFIRINSIRIWNHLKFHFLFFPDIDPTQVFQSFFSGAGAPGGQNAEFNFGGFPGGFSFQFG